MLDAGKLNVGTDELTAALDLGPSGGLRCRTLGELVEFATRLVADDEVLKKLDDSDGRYPEIEPHRWWFRGARSDYRLDAGLFRTKPRDVNYPVSTDSYGRLEQRIRHEYTLMTRGRFSGLSSDIWDSLFEMQHYGLPTRLLDWTFSLGQALWFALNPRDEGSGSEKQPDRPVIWILNPRLLAKASLGIAGLDDFAYLERHGSHEQMTGWKPAPDIPEQPRQPGWLLDYLSKRENPGHFPVLASWTNPRMAAQLGCFTLQSGAGATKSPSLDEYAAQTHPCRFLLKLCFEPDADLKKAYHALSFIGVNRYTLLPEIIETCAWIKELRKLRR
jgi:hypothetical protein